MHGTTTTGTTKGSPIESGGAGTATLATATACDGGHLFPRLRPASQATPPLLGNCMTTQNRRSGIRNEHGILPQSDTDKQRLETRTCAHSHPSTRTLFPSNSPPFGSVTLGPINEAAASKRRQGEEQRERRRNSAGSNGAKVAVACEKGDGIYPYIQATCNGVSKELGHGRLRSAFLGSPASANTRPNVSPKGCSTSMELRGGGGDRP